MEANVPARQRFGRRIIVTLEKGIEAREGVSRRPFFRRPGELGQTLPRPFGAVTPVGRIGCGNFVREAGGSGVSFVKEPVPFLQPQLSRLQAVRDLLGEPPGLRIVAGRLGEQSPAQSEAAPVTQRYEKLRIVGLRARLGKKGLDLVGSC